MDSPIENTPGGFTLKMFNDMAVEWDKCRPKPFSPPVSLQTSIRLDVQVELQVHEIDGRFFFTETRQAHDYIELTPYNKGNIWKIRCFKHSFHVYFGTTIKAYCTTIRDAIRFITK